MSTARSVRQKASVSHLPLWPPHAPAPRALPMPQDRGFDRGCAERCELAHDRQIPPTRCRAAGPTLHPLASEPDYERSVLSCRRFVSRSNRAPLDKGDKCKKYVKPWFYAPCHRVRWTTGLFGQSVALRTI